jgi:hypothetical protein
MLAMNKSNNRDHVRSRLVCLALATVGLLLIATVLQDADPQTTQSASTPAAAGLTPCRTIAGLALQAEGLQDHGAATPTFALLGAAIQLLRRS